MSKRKCDRLGAGGPEWNHKSDQKTREEAIESLEDLKSLILESADWMAGLEKLGVINSSDVEESLILASSYISTAIDKVME